MGTDPSETIQQTIADPKLQLAIYTATGRLMQGRTDAIAPALLPDYQDLRTQANAIKRHTIDNLDFYLEQFEMNVAAARIAREAADKFTALTPEKPRFVAGAIGPTRTSGRSRVSVAMPSFAAR